MTLIFHQVCRRCRLAWITIATQTFHLSLGIARFGLRIAVTAIVLAAIAVSSQAQALVDLGATAPTPGAKDIAQLSTAGNQTNPDGLNYYTDNQTGHSAGEPGQTFTTGTNSAGYVLNSLAIKTGGLGSSSYSGIGTAQPYYLHIYSVSGSTATLLQTYTSANFTFSDGDWLKWTGLSVALAAKTNYAWSFGKASSTSGWEPPAVATGNLYTGGEIGLISPVTGAITYGSSHGFDAVFDVGLILSTQPNISQITVSPTTNVFGGTVVTFTAGVTGAQPLYYQWQFNSGGGYTNISGANTNTLVLNAAITNTGSYQLVLTNTYGAVTGAPVSLTVTAVTAIPSQAFANVADYGFMFWSNGPASSLYGIKTSRYGMSFNSANLTPTTLFPIANPSPESAVLTESWAASFPTSSPPVSLSCQVVANGVTNQVGTLIANTALIECGKYFQRRWQKVQAAGLPLDTNRCGLEVAAWPDRLSFVLRLAPSNAISSATLQMKLTLTNIYNTLLTSGVGGALQASNGTGFVFLPSAGSSAISYNPTNATVTVTTALNNWQTSQQGSVGLVIYPVATNVAWTLTNAVATEAAPLTLAVTPVLPAGSGLAVNYDTDRGWYDVSLPASGTAGDNGILRAQVTVTNNSPTPRVVRINFDGVPFSIPGITAVLRDASLNPVGLPVQLSKDWDTPSSYPMFANQWFHGLTMLTVPPNANLNLELTMAGQNWGGVPAATHSQLCVYGYGNGNQNQQWDEAALGNYGESLTYDVEHVLTDNDGADSRPILLLTTNGSKGGWGINLGGANFLRYYDSGGTQRQHRRMRTQYARYCPNLTQVTYAGQTDDGKMALSYSASIGRSDDYTRGLHQLTVNVNSNLAFNRLVFFQMPGDSYAYNNGTNLAYGYGNQTNAVREWSAASSGLNKNVGLAVALTNSQPWISIHGLVYSAGDSSYNPGVKGYIIRSWKARINGVDNVPPYLIEHSLASGYIGSSMDIVPPPGVTTLQTGDYVQAVIERIYLPSVPGEYYGPDLNLATAVTNYANTYKMVLREAVGNNLLLNISAGMLVQTRPSIVIGVTNDFAQFSVTGGLNYVPVTFTGVSTYQNPLVEELVGTSWSVFNQAVNGNDFWQADYNSISLSWDITFNLKVGSTNYQDISALQSSPVTRTFRFRNPNTVTSIPSVSVVFTNASWLGGSAGGGGGASGFQLSGSGPVGQSWRLFSTTNLALSWAQWTLETSNTFPGNGQFNYTSPVPTNALQQFYRMVSP